MDLSIENRISEKAKEKFLRYGVKTISMDDISKDLGMSKKTIYKYYPDKKALVKAVTIQIVDDVQKICTDAFEKSNNAIEQLFAIIDFINSFFDNMNPTVFHDLEKYYPDSFNILRIHHEEFIYNNIRENFKRGIKEKLYRKDLNIDIHAKLRLGQIRLAHDPDLFPANQFNLKEVQLASLEMTMLGIVTEKGRMLVARNKK